MKNFRFQSCSVVRNSANFSDFSRQSNRIVARAPLSDLQYAYLLGELGDYSLGGPALFYEEYACEGLDLLSFSQALHQLMRRHEMLRATFDASGTLRVHHELPVPLSYRSLRGVPEHVWRKTIADSRDELYRTATVLTEEAPFSVRVFALDGQTIVQVCGRLLAIDGFSGEIFAQELKTLLAGGQLAPLRFTFREYRKEMEARKELAEYATARAYWLDRLESIPAAPALPLRRRGTDPSPQLTRRIHRMPADTWAGFSAAIKKNRLTPTMAIGAAFCEVLRQWSKTPDFTITLMYGDRAPVNPEVGSIIGNFSSTVLLECAAQREPSTFIDRAKAWRRQLASDLQHSAFSGVSVIRELNQRHGNSRDALMPVVFTSMLGVGEDDSGVFLEHLGWRRLEGRVRTPQVALDHQVFMADNELVVQWDTADDLYVPGVIDDMFAAYATVLQRLATEPQAWESESFELTPQPQLAIRLQVNDTAAPTPAVTLHELFTRQAQRTPDRPAVITPTETLTYAQLWDRANSIATALRARAVQPGETIGVTAWRGGHQIAAQLGILMAGGAYVPISPQWPSQRREQVSRICDLRLLLIGEDVTKEGVPEQVTVLCIAEQLAEHSAAAAVSTRHDGESLAYVIFTSGTSGTPKGVMINHASAANTILDVNERFAVTAEDRVLAVSDYTFDLSVWDVFGLLAAGGAVVVPEPELTREVTHLYDLCVRHRVTLWNSVPAYLAMFVEFVRSGERPPLQALRLAMVSGDWVPVTLGRDLLDAAPSALCVSLGGATEASIWSNYYPVATSPPEEWVSIPYGFPLRNQRFHVLDRELRHRPDWVAGELFIAGRGLAEGYLGAPELTAAAFLTHPRTGERLYRTGDWGRYWPDGTLEFLGRDDPQVKINGYRVELTEIEAVLLTHPAVTDTVVVTKRGSRGVSLIGFAASELPAAILEGELRAHLQERLPSYMVPRVIQVRRSLPLTSNGKVDRRLLGEQALAVNVAAGLAESEAPVGATERALTRLWEDLLGVPHIGRHDDFFASGGNSLHAAQLMNRIELEFGQRLPLATLFTATTVAKLAQHLTSRVVSPNSNLVSLASGDGEPLVLVHPVGGDLLCYRHLVASLQARRSVLGLSAVQRSTALTIEEMASQYLAQVLALTGDTPIRLAGWSLGGVIAYEMGRRLLHERRDCSVVMIDPWIRRQGSAKPSDADLVGSFLYNITESGVELANLELDPEEPALEALHRIWSAPNEVPALKRLTVEELSGMFQIFAHNTDALLRYSMVVEPDLPLQIIEAQAGLDGPGGHYLAPAAEVLPAFGAALGLPGNHFTVLDRQTAPLVAQLL